MYINKMTDGVGGYIKWVFSAFYETVLNAYFRLVKQDIGLLIAFFIVILIWAINAHSLPWLDAAWELTDKQLFFYRGEFEAYLERIKFDHPLGRLLVLTLFFQIFGLYAFATTLPGMLLNLAAVFSIFSLAKKYGNTNCARIAAILLACDPIFIATSIHTLPDHYFVALLIVSCYAYANNKIWLWAATLIAMVLNKETALLVVIAFIGQWIISIPFALKEHKKIDYLKLLIPLYSIVVFKLYLITMEQYFKQARWTYDGKSGFESVLENLFNIVEKLQRMWSGNWFEHLNLLNVTVFNFQWIISGLAYWWLLIFFYKRISSEKINYFDGDIKFAQAFTMVFLAVAMTATSYYLFGWKQYIVILSCLYILPISFFLAKIIVFKISKTQFSDFSSPLCAIILFEVAYIVLVLTYNTFATPRYSLPVTVFLLFLAAFCIDFLSDRLRKSVRYFFYSAAILVMAIRFFSSIDPITDRLSAYSYPGFDKIKVYGETIYMSKIGVMDTGVYNGQYLSILKRKTKILRDYGEGRSDVLMCSDIDQAQWDIIAEFTNFKSTGKVLSVCTP